MSEREELIRLDERLSCDSLSHFIRAAWHLIEPGRPYTHGWHIDAIAEHLEAIVHGELRNLIINMPPRHMKSIAVSVMFPAWAWLQRPALRWLFASYSGALSGRDSLKCRRIISSPWYRERFGHLFSLKRDSNSRDKFENDATGHRIATSVGGRGTGEGGDIVVADDPHKAGEVESAAMREEVIDWWDGEMSTRGDDPKTVSKVIVMQRLHELDLSGHCLAQGGYEHLCLPAHYDSRRHSSTSIGWSDPRKEDGDLLWPNRFGEAEMAGIARPLGPTRAAGQLEQRPAPAEGNMVKRAWWQRYASVPQDLERVALSIDLPFKDKSNSKRKSDMAAFQIWGLRGANRYLLHQVWRRMAFTGQVQTLRELKKEWPQSTPKLVGMLREILVEDAANGAAIMDHLQGEFSGIIPMSPSKMGGKEVRVAATAPAIESGNYYLPSDAIATFDVEAYINEFATFPNGANDDQVDATTQMHLRYHDAVDYGAMNLYSDTKTSQWGL